MDNKLKTAFTLIELLVVIAIIGILSGLIIVGMSSSTQSAIVAKSQIFSSSLRDSLLMNIVEQFNFNDIADAKIGTTPVIADIKDSWGLNNATTVGSAPIIRGGSDCITGKCIQFNGPSAAGDPQPGDYVSFPNTNYPKGDNPITLEAWINPKLAQTGEIFGARWNDPTGLLFAGGNFFVHFSMYDNLNNYHNYAYDRKALTLNKWYHVVGTYGNSLVKICLNADCETWATLPPRLGPGYTTILGSTDSNYNHFNGLIDDVRVYNAAIPTSLIREHYYVGLSSLLAKNNITRDEYINRVMNYE